MKDLIKCCWPLSFFVIAILFCFYMIHQELKLKSFIIDNALKGNSGAIFMIEKLKKPWELPDEIVYEAIKGNPNALHIIECTKEKK